MFSSGKKGNPCTPLFGKQPNIFRVGPGPRAKHLGPALGHPRGSFPGEWMTELITQKMLSLYVFIREAVNKIKKTLNSLGLQLKNVFIYGNCVIHLCTAALLRREVYHTCVLAVSSEVTKV